jgi:uncharacterized protein YkwD
MRLHHCAISCLLLLAVPLDAAAGNLYAAINQLRAGAGGCPAADNLPPLRPQAALERVARDLSRGGDLKQSEKDNGYRAARSRALNITGDGVEARAEEILARPDYCPQLQDSGLTEIGIYLDQRQLWVVIAAPFAPAVSLSAQAAGQRVLELVNRARAARRSCGNQAFRAAPPVRWNDVLAGASRLHAEDMARHDYFSHAGRDGSTPAQRVERAGYRYRATGENIAAGTQMQAEDAVAGWIKSPGHCANLMNPIFTEMGVGFAVNAASEMGIYWAQAFGTPR